MIEALFLHLSIIMTTIHKRWVLNGVLLLLVIALIAFIIQQLHTPRVAVNTLYDESMGDEIVSIRIYRNITEEKKLASNIELEKISNKWMMVSPIKASVDNRKIKHLLTLLSDTVDAQYSVKGKDLSIFGLDNKRLSVFFNGVEIQFGSLNPISYKRYLRKADTIYMVAETVNGLLLSSVDSFVQKNSN